MAESQTVQCNTDKTQCMTRANKLAEMNHVTDQRHPLCEPLLLILSNSTSNLRVALGGMTGGNPRAP